jgi:predicted phosphate transport protein (TIGR00153 family)
VPFQVIPREQSFFDLFEELAGRVSEGAGELRGLALDLGQGESITSRLRDLEHAADDVTHRTIETLNTSFVTPFDREDIHGLVTRLDDVVDAEEAVADLLVLHRVTEVLPELRQQADVLVRATEAVGNAIHRLRTLHDLNGFLVEINRLENEGDRIYRKAVARLYSGEYKAMDVLKWRDVLDQMEAAIDACEDISNTIESIALKRA